MKKIILGLLAITSGVTMASTVESTIKVDKEIAKNSNTFVNHETKVSIDLPYEIGIEAMLGYGNDFIPSYSETGVKFTKGFGQYGKLGLSTKLDKTIRGEYTNEYKFEDENVRIFGGVEVEKKLSDRKTLLQGHEQLVSYSKALEKSITPAVIAEINVLKSKIDFSKPQEELTKDENFVKLNELYTKNADKFSELEKTRFELMNFLNYENLRDRFKTQRGKLYFGAEHKGSLENGDNYEIKGEVNVKGSYDKVETMFTETEIKSSVLTPKTEKTKVDYKVWSLAPEIRVDGKYMLDVAPLTIKGTISADSLIERTRKNNRKEESLNIHKLMVEASTDYALKFDNFTVQPEIKLQNTVKHITKTDHLTIPIKDNPENPLSGVTYYDGVAKSLEYTLAVKPNVSLKYEFGNGLDLMAKVGTNSYLGIKKATTEIKAPKEKVPGGKTVVENPSESYKFKHLNTTFRFETGLKYTW